MLVTNQLTSVIRNSLNPVTKRPLFADAVPYGLRFSFDKSKSPFIYIILLYLPTPLLTIKSKTLEKNVEIIF